MKETYGMEFNQGNLNIAYSQIPGLVSCGLKKVGHKS